LWNRLTDAAEERVHVALNPTAAEFDDGDHGRRLRLAVRGGEIRHVFGIP
jgi:hypothetical protein